MAKTKTFDLHLVLGGAVVLKVTADDLTETVYHTMLHPEKFIFMSESLKRDYLKLYRRESLLLDNEFDAFLEKQSPQENLALLQDLVLSMEGPVDAGAVYRWVLEGDATPALIKKFLKEKESGFTHALERIVVRVQESLKKEAEEAKRDAAKFAKAKAAKPAKKAIGVTSARK